MTDQSTDDRVLFDLCLEQHAVCRQQIAQALLDYVHAQGAVSADASPAVMHKSSTAMETLVALISRQLETARLPVAAADDIRTSRGFTSFSGWFDWSLLGKSTICAPVRVTIYNFGRVYLSDAVGAEPYTFSLSDVVGAESYTF